MKNNRGVNKPFACRNWKWSNPKSKHPKNKKQTEVWYYENGKGTRDVHLDVYDGDFCLGHISFTMPARNS